ncbi:MAG TPA: 5'-methylthioadenosine/adenosylhomocysteine nucleosidase [Candidatus Merdivicinus intestinavium]|mgnify:CR=1 FL=1|nr:5'-methylthioadenosine/adenosylhomocysteine nucleosidase [Candidatus Merdivicinus intestinavium]
MKPVGIIGAMGVEVEKLKGRLENCRESVFAGRSFYEGKLNGTDVVVVCAGIGKVNAAITTQLLIDRFDVESVINTGIAGGAHPGIKVRDVVISDVVVYHDMDPRILAISYPHLSEFTADPALIERAERACDARKVRWMTGKVATGDQFISDSAVKADIVARTAPCCVEMEGGAIAHTAAANGVPFVVIRCISDNADNSADMDYATFEKLAADDAAAIIEAMLQ